MLYVCRLYNLSSILMIDFCRLDLYFFKYGCLKMMLKGALFTFQIQNSIIYNINELIMINDNFSY